MTHQTMTLDRKKDFDMEGFNFLYQVKKELSLKSIHDAVKLVTCVFHCLRQTLTLQSSMNLLNKLPDFLKLVFVANWKQHEPQTKVKHLDEFVYLVMERCESTQNSLFKSEVQTLSVVILTLKKLHKITDIEKLDGLTDSFWRELNEVPAESVAA